MSSSINFTTDASPEEPLPKPEQEVLEFFLKYFAIQLGVVEEDSPITEALCLDMDAAGPDHTYELVVKTKNGIRTRRMALGPLGENTGSKSQCFKVIYDEILVVKIPPGAITDFEDYVDHIKGERQIAGRISSSIDCIAPSVSAILRKIPRFAAGAELNFMAVEKGYIHMLRKSPWFQDYLKIGDSFVFFMNLSQYFFLGHVIDHIHNIKRTIQEEIFGQFDILWNLMAFEEVFGTANAGIFFAVNEIYTNYEDRVNELLKKYGSKAASYMFKRKEWFLNYLAEKNIGRSENSLPVQFYKELDEIFNDIFSHNRQDVEAYRRMMREHVQRKMFNQNRIQFKGIIINILELLYRLKQRGVAIRDLKPDNIFVKNETFLENGGEFILGLIDFETAVSFGTEKSEMIPQPLLAGTPSYATPSHFVSNPVLRNIFTDLDKIMYLQDWHAGLGMIYYVVTGQHLFEQSRKWVKETRAIMQKARAASESEEEAFKKASKLFWQSAEKEFTEKITKNGKILKSVEIVLPDSVRVMLKNEMIEQHSTLQMRIHKKVYQQENFRQKDALIRSSHEVITRCRKNWEDGVNIPKTKPEIRDQIIRFFVGLEQLKFSFDEFRQSITLLSRESLSLSTHDLLFKLFLIVRHSMYREEWGDLVITAEDFNQQAVSPLKKHEETVAYDSRDSSDEKVFHEETISVESENSFLASEDDK